MMINRVQHSFWNEFKQEKLSRLLWIRKIPICQKTWMRYESIPLTQ